MLKLGGKIYKIKNLTSTASSLFRVSTTPIPKALRDSRAFVVNSSPIPCGFAHYILLESQKYLLSELPSSAGYSVIPDDYSYLREDDVVRLFSDNPSIRVLYRAASSHNSILITEQCNHYCLMCSQPPKRIDDSWILEEVEELIPLIPRYAGEIGFTGGEPTLYGERFLNLLRLTKSYLPHTSIHILSNGRAFKDDSFAKAYADINHHDVMIGIPIYSDDPAQHDYIVQARNAFDETVRGVINLKRHNQKVEIRVVIHKQSLDRLTQLCEFIGRNLLFVDHVALMGLEMMGFTRANLEMLWVDPHEYKDKLSEAVRKLVGYGMNVSVYNHQLCLVNDDIRPYYRKSISDWKNEYAPECAGCLRINECGGFFSSSLLYQYSSNIKPYKE